VADIAKATDVRHFTYSSAIAVDKGRTGIGHFDSKNASEAHIQRLGIGYTRPSTFMEILALPGMSLELGKLNFVLCTRTKQRSSLW
jgi:uncharacterized protein YbjT (DUF2867 family)